MTWYNEYAAHPAAWLRFLIHFNLVSPGEVNRKDIKRVKAIPKDAERVHLFAGCGGWDVALDLAGWPAGRSVWTGSPPCQPFSQAGRQLGAGDDRHLWPEMLRVVRKHRPDVVFGEQVAESIRFGWLDGVCTDMEALGYAVGATVLGAHSAGAPHQRQRVFWVAYDLGNRCPPRVRGGSKPTKAGTRQRADADRVGASGRKLANPNSTLERAGRAGPGQATSRRALGQPDRRSSVGKLADAHYPRFQRRYGRGMCERARQLTAGADRTWLDAILHPCSDGRSRRIPSEPAFQPLVDGVCPGRVDVLRGSGNALVPATAAIFVQAFLESEKELRG